MSILEIFINKIQRIMNKNDWKGLIAYFFIAILFGGFTAFTCGVVHEDNDRCNYYNGKWCYKDLGIVTISSVLGGIINWIWTLALVGAVLF